MQQHHTTGAKAHGWNTWWTRSMLAHVRLPEGLCVGLGVKHYGAHTLTEALVYSGNDPGSPRLQPGVRTWDGTYTCLTLDWLGLAVQVESAVVKGDLLLLITPLATPPKTPLLIVDLGMCWNRPGTVQRDGQGLKVNPAGHSMVRLHATGRSIDEPDTPLRGPYLARRLDQPVAVCTGRARTRASIRKQIHARRPPDPVSRSDKLQTVIRQALAWNTIYDPTWDAVVSPVSRVWNTGWGGAVLFCWDTYFAAWLAAAAGQQGLAYANAAAITAQLTTEGFVPNFAGANGAKSHDRSQPPIGAMTYRYLHHVFGDRTSLEAAYPALLRWNRWWPEQRVTNGLLCWGSNRFPAERRIGFRHEDSAVHNRQAAAYESGLDNAPMYDDIPFDARRNQLKLADTGLNALYIFDCEALAEIAGILGRNQEAVELRARAGQFRERINDRLWSENDGMYLNRRTDTGRFSRRLAPTLFYPLLAGAPDARRADRMVKEHLMNPAEFAGRWTIPASARNDPVSADNDYWRGRIWAPLNFLVYLGLRRYRCRVAGRDLAARSARLLLKEWKTHGHIHENYNSVTGAGCDVASSDPYYHWGALLALPALIESGAIPDYPFES